MGKRINQIKWGIILTYVTLFLNIAVSVLYTPVMLRILGAEEHGLFSTVSSAMSWISLLGLGLTSSYIRFFAKFDNECRDDKIASLNGMFLLLFCLLGIIALACGVFIANRLELIFADGLTEQEYSKARILAFIVTVELAIGFPAAVFNAIIRAREKFVAIRLVHLFQCISSPMVTLPLLLMGYGSVAMVSVTTLVNAVAYLYYVIYCFGKLHTKFSFRRVERSLLKEIAVYSGLIAVNSLINQVNTSLDKVLLARLVNTTSVSVYTIGFSLYSYYSSFSSAITGNITPRIHKIVSENISDKARLRVCLTQQFIKFGRIQLYIQMLLFTGILFFGRAFIAFWAGPGYENAYYVAILLCAAATIPLCQHMAIEIQRAQNKHKFRTVVYSIMTLINIVLTVILSQRYGEIGAAVGTAFATLVVDAIVMNIYYHRKLYIDILAFWKTIICAMAGIIIPVLFGMIIYYTVSMDSIGKLLGFIALYVVIYCLSVWCISLNYEEKRMFLSGAKRVYKK